MGQDEDRIEGSDGVWRRAGLARATSILADLPRASMCLVVPCCQSCGQVIDGSDQPTGEASEVHRCSVRRRLRCQLAKVLRRLADAVEPRLGA